jgi:hypothetical protein
VPTIIDKIQTTIINPILGLFVSIALLYFLWGVYDLFVAKENAAQGQQGMQHVIWGAIGFAIMVSAYGLIRFVCVSITVCT